MSLSDEVTINIATGVLTLIGTMFTGIMSYLMMRLNQKTDRAAATANEVKETLATTTERHEHKLGAIAKTTAENKVQGEEIHRLVNGQMSVQLRVSWLAMKRIADLTGDEEDGKLALLAQEAYTNHEIAQAAHRDKDAVAQKVDAETDGVNSKSLVETTEAK